MNLDTLLTWWHATTATSFYWSWILLLLVLWILWPWIGFVRWVCIGLILGLVLTMLCETWMLQTWPPLLTYAYDHYIHSTSTESLTTMNVKSTAVAGDSKSFSLLIPVLSQWMIRVLIQQFPALQSSSTLLESTLQSSLQSLSTCSCMASVQYVLEGLVFLWMHLTSTSDELFSIVNRWKPLLQQTGFFTSESSKASSSSSTASLSSTQALSEWGIHSVSTLSSAQQQSLFTMMNQASLLPTWNCPLSGQSLWQSQQPSHKLINGCSAIWNVDQSKCFIYTSQALQPILQQQSTKTNQSFIVKHIS